MTAFRSLTDEQLAARWDDEPWADEETRERYAAKPDWAEFRAWAVHFAPRVECIPSRDGKKHEVNMTGAGSAPFCSCGWHGKRHEGPILADHLRAVARPPVNPILRDFRNSLGHYETADGEEADASDQAKLWLADWDKADGTPAEIEHARVVLGRLAAL